MPGYLLKNDLEVRVTLARMWISMAVLTFKANYAVIRKFIELKKFLINASIIRKVYSDMLGFLISYICFRQQYEAVLTIRVWSPTIVWLKTVPMVERKKKRKKERKKKKRENWVMR